MSNQGLRRKSSAILILGVFTLLFIPLNALGQNPTRGCLSCHSDPTLTKRAGGKIVNLYIDPARYSKGVHANTECSECHYNFALQSPHIKETQATLEESSSVACRDCHEKLYTEFIGSLHGKAMKTQETVTGQKTAPSCGECHNVHYGTKYPKAKTAAMKMDINRSCEECHTKAFEELTGNYHYRALVLGYDKSASCTDCHDIHNLQKMEAGTEEAAEGCKKCHPGANANLAGFLIHSEPESADAPLITKIILYFMTGLTAGVLGLMYFHSFLWFLRKFIEKRRG